MKLPWKLGDELEEKEEKLEQLRGEIEELEEERDSWRNRYEAEKDRRSELSRKKQEAEEQLKKLRQNDRENSEEQDDEEERAERSSRNLGFDEAERLLKKLGGIEAESREMVTVYSPGELEELADLRELKNSVPGDLYQDLSQINGFAAFQDPELGCFVLKSGSFLDELFRVSESFETEPLLDFMESEKLWCVVTAGKSTLYREEGGEIEELESVGSRVDRKHSKGGFSQSRFERKREEQIERHLDDTEQMLDGHDDVLLVGDKRLCKELSGNHVSSFDPNRSLKAALYGFSIRHIDPR